MLILYYYMLWGLAFRLLHVISPWICHSNTFVETQIELRDLGFSEAICGHF